MSVDSFDNVLSAARAGADWAWERIYADLAPRIGGYLRANGAADPADHGSATRKLLNLL